MSVLGMVIVYTSNIYHASDKESPLLAKEARSGAPAGSTRDDACASGGNFGSGSGGGARAGGRADMYMCVSTLQDFVKAIGGELKITARFPEGTVEINQSAAVGRTEDGD